MGPEAGEGLSRRRNRAMPVTWRDKNQNPQPLSQSAPAGREKASKQNLVQAMASIGASKKLPIVQERRIRVQRRPHVPARRAGCMSGLKAELLQDTPNRRTPPPIPTLESGTPASAVPFHQDRVVAVALAFHHDFGDEMSATAKCCRMISARHRAPLELEAKRHGECPHQHLRALPPRLRSDLRKINQLQSSQSLCVRWHTNKVLQVPRYSQRRLSILPRQHQRTRSCGRLAQAGHQLQTERLQTLG